MLDKYKTLYLHCLILPHRWLLTQGLLCPFSGWGKWHWERWVTLGQEKLGKSLKWAYKDCWVFCLAHFSRTSAPFVVFELFFNCLNCRKLVTMQMILVHRNANELCLAEMQLIVSLWLRTLLVFICNSRPHSWLPRCVSVLRILLGTARMP